MTLQRLKFFSLVICLAIITTSCGSSEQPEVDISTAVAQTVQAQNSLTKVAALPTLTPAPAIQASVTPEGMGIANTPAAASNPGCALSARLVGENPPDNTLLTPGENFYKTWTLENTGSCYWDKSYNMVFWDGDLMGGLISYPLTEVVAPGGTFNITVYLQAPATEGIAKGYWRLQAPWGEYFGVGPQSISFYVQVEVSERPKQKYGVTNVTYNLVRDPAEGCPLNVRYILYATVASNGPVTFDYFWDQSDGNESGVKQYEFKEAGTTTFKRDWLISLNDNPNPRWIKFVVTAPTYTDFGEVIIDHDCLHNN